MLLRNKRRLSGSDENTFSVVNVDEFNSTMDQVTGAIAAVVVPITLIILVVGGIVVMNIMLVSVTERTFEVGLRKAIGATGQQIMTQFLIESALLCFSGGIIGLLLAWSYANRRCIARNYNDHYAVLCRTCNSCLERYRHFSRHLSCLESRPAGSDRCTYKVMKCLDLRHQA